jgi:hypothetical protein
MNTHKKLKMTNQLYKHNTKNHIVRVLLVCDEHTARTTDDSSGLLKQIISHRQKKWLNKSYDEEYYNDENFSPFAMELDTFNEVYTPLKENE